MLARDQYHSLAELIDAVKASGTQDDNFCVYGEDRDALEISARYFIAGYPEVIDDKEIYPPSVRRESLSYLYSGESFVDVVMLAQKQKPDATYADYVKALNHYQDNDDFLDL
ncbi:hypothetical protein RRX38_04375 [Pseudomonas sp. DTU_2021_1001937_2_SI_NGA_ILE_001]|uniref:DUF7716 domain-containing protein n=1 Tax=Pseudomonas sp. DTU_2021_1001937_2_SI_NGA_ILE_001 TaxID=3077589 RepID=UPI0028FC278B|nr:hypothetical protein [Pseudomonas sp. DTU_2021_1001937_2_SI_NGA_ILE_001]WNW10417.1 hypothetical protein RRX38_04375 [Pseudomonas sp. DTU_2021_1001937_2_SI_NGA_ILE_001]